MLCSTEATLPLLDSQLTRDTSWNKHLAEEPIHSTFVKPWRKMRNCSRISAPTWDSGQNRNLQSGVHKLCHRKKVWAKDLWQRNLIFWREFAAKLWIISTRNWGNRFHPRFLKFDTGLRTIQGKHKDNEKILVFGLRKAAASFPQEYNSVSAAAQQQKHVFAEYNNIHVNRTQQEEKKKKH